MITLNNAPATTMDLIRLILINQIDIRPEYVNIYDEKWTIPPIDNMFITIEYRNARTIANRNIFDASVTPPIEWQELNMLENIVVGVFSRNLDAQLYKEQVLMAVRSQYAQYLQEQYAFKIARAGNIQDLSELEGAAMLKRYDIELSVYTWYERTITVGALIPPFSIKVIANDTGAGEIIETITQTLITPN